MIQRGFMGLKSLVLIYINVDILVKELSSRIRPWGLFEGARQEGKFPENGWKKYLQVAGTER